MSNLSRSILFCFAFIFALDAYSSSPSLSFEKIAESSVVTSAENRPLRGSSYEKTNTLAELGYPIFTNENFMIVPWLRLFQSNINWTSKDEGARHREKRSMLNPTLWIAQSGEDRTFSFFGAIAQRETLNYSLGDPMNEITLGTQIKHSFFDGLIKGATWSPFSFGLIQRQFPGADRTLIYLSQQFSLGNKNIFIEIPGTISFTVKNEKDRYIISSTIDDFNLTPFEDEEGVKGWSVDSFRANLVAGYENLIFDPIVLSIKGGVIAEWVSDFDLKGKKLWEYRTKPAPYLNVSLKSWL